MAGSGLTLLLLLLVGYVDKLAAFPQDVDCLIFGTCKSATLECAKDEMVNEALKKCEKKKQVDLPSSSGGSGRDSCFNVADNEISSENFLGDLRTVQDCNRNTTCEDYRDKGFVCVPFYTCRTGVVVTDGIGLIDLRSADENPDCCTSKNAVLDLSDQKCNTINVKNTARHVCCKGPNVRVKPCSITSDCGGSSQPETDKISPDPFEQCGRIITDPIIKLTGLSQRTTEGDVSTRSTGGDIAQPGEFPHMCLVYRVVKGQKTYLAGASLIAPNKVLSVAHKFYVANGKTVEDIREDKQIYVRCGEYNVKLKAEYLDFQDSRVSQVLISPEYSEKRVHHDLVILVTQENFVYQEHISPVCLPQPGENFDRYEDCWSTGWGADQFPDEKPVFYSDDLRKVQLPMVNKNDCFNKLKAHEKFKNVTGFKLHDSWVCAGGKMNVDTCKGDGGSPHVCKKNNKWVQVGAVNWGIKCGQEGIPSVYSSVAADMCWIDWVMSCTPLSSRFVNLKLADTVDLRASDNTVPSMNKLTEKQCGAWRDSHPKLINQCKVDYSAKKGEETDARSVDRK